MTDGVNYGPGIVKLENTSTSSNWAIEVETSPDSNLFYSDIAQSRFFTISLDKLLYNGAPIQFKFPKPPEYDYPEGTKVNVYNDFLPVKNISVNFTSYDNLSIPFNVFGNLSLLHRKRLATITINCYDLSDDRVEKAVQRWEEACFPNSRYVAYLSDVASKFEYTSYGVTGKISYCKTLYVIPSGSVSVNRGYDDNSEKIVSFSVVAVGEPGASSNGSSGNITNENGSKNIGGFATGTFGYATSAWGEIITNVAQDVTGIPLRNILTDFNSQ